MSQKNKAIDSEVNNFGQWFIVCFYWSEKSHDWSEIFLGKENPEVKEESENGRNINWVKLLLDIFLILRQEISKVS